LTVQRPAKAHVTAKTESPAPTGSKAPARAGPARPGTRAARHPRAARPAPRPAAPAPQTVKLQPVPTGQAYVCLVDGSGKILAQPHQQRRHGDAHGRRRLHVRDEVAAEPSTERPTSTAVQRSSWPGCRPGPAATEAPEVVGHGFGSRLPLLRGDDREMHALARSHPMAAELGHQLLTVRGARLRPSCQLNQRRSWSEPTADQHQVPPPSAGRGLADLLAGNNRKDLMLSARASTMASLLSDVEREPAPLGAVQLLPLRQALPRRRRRVALRRRRPARRLGRLPHHRAHPG
jgi:hypothetical protein